MRKPSDLLSDRYNLLNGEIYLTGIQALVRLPMDVRRMDAKHGRNTAGYISGYEGSPLAGYDIELSRHKELLEELNIVFHPGLNEELAATAIQGTQLVPSYADSTYEGISGYWYGKAPGLDRSTDALRHNVMAGTHHLGGVLAIVGNDPAAQSSSVPSASEQLFADLGMPVFYPSDSQDILDLGIHAIALSRASGLWVGFKIVTNVADGSSTAIVGEDRIKPILPEVLQGGKPYVHKVVGRLLQPNLTDLERTRDGIRLEIARQYATLNRINRIVVSHPHDLIGIVAAGRTFYDLQHALEKLGLSEPQLEERGIRLLNLKMIYPLDGNLIREFALGLQEIIVVEEKRSFIEDCLRIELYGQENAPKIAGKRDLTGAKLFPTEGELDSDFIADILARNFALLGSVPSVTAWQEIRSQAKERVQLPLALRTAYYCSGCPHNTSRQTPEGSLIGGGIGCHSLSLFMSEAQVGDMMGITQMGGEGAQWIGMAPFLKRNHLLQNLGDGTFHHSGSLAVRASVAANVNITYKILHNSAVALTGGQQVEGEMSLANITRSLLAEGVKKIIITSDNPKKLKKENLPAGVLTWHRDRIIESQEELAKISGTTVLIHDQLCAANLRRKRKRGLVEKPKQRIYINERICEGCGDCAVKSNCLSVQPHETEYGTKTKIDQSSCNLDFSCIKGDCPAFVEIIPRAKALVTTSAKLVITDLPEPEYIVPTDTFVIRILGVGGTGIVTVSQILGVAANLAGKKVRALDMTGLAQKGGAVISDIKVSDKDEMHSNKATMGECDLYLAADILAAAQPKNLAVTNVDRSVAVISTSVISTGLMVTDRDSKFPNPDLLRDRILAATRAKESFLIDSHDASKVLFGDDQFANILLVGSAFQLGTLPIPLQAIQEAIRLNNVQVESNLRAFELGRLAVARPEEFAKLMHSPLADKKIKKLNDAELIEERAQELTEYQNLEYANKYRVAMNQVLLAEKDLAPGKTAFSRAVAEYLFKLMAYKDEYEVARLSLDPETTAKMAAEFGADAKITYLLHPPILRSLGVSRKLRFGSWFRIIFMLLRKMRFIRGTKLDLFGYAAVRKLERNLLQEYRETIFSLLPTLNSANYDLAVQIASLPDLIRGYEEIKVKNAKGYRTQLAESILQFTELISIEPTEGR